MESPHSKYRHVFVVVRVDTYDELDSEFDMDRLAAPSVYFTEEDAAADAERLNALAAGRGAKSRYAWLLSRLKED